jgi:hypothetical protein
MSDEGDVIVPSQRIVSENDPVEHNVTISTPPTHPKKYIVWRKRPTYIIIGSLVVGLIIMALAYIWQVNRGTNAVVGLNHTIEDISSQLSDARHQLATFAANSDDRDACRVVYQAHVTEAQALVIIGITSAIANPTTDPTVKQRQRDEISAAGEVLKKEIADRSAYEKRGAPLPCPVSFNG